jgi:hypothetical protein
MTAAAEPRALCPAARTALSGNCRNSCPTFHKIHRRPQGCGNSPRKIRASAPVWRACSGSRSCSSSPSPSAPRSATSRGAGGPCSSARSRGGWFPELAAEEDPPAAGPSREQGQRCVQVATFDPKGLPPSIDWSRRTLPAPGALGGPEILLRCTERQSAVDRDVAKPAGPLPGRHRVAPVPGRARGSLRIGPRDRGPLTTRPCTDRRLDQAPDHVPTTRRRASGRRSGVLAGGARPPRHSSARCQGLCAAGVCAGPGRSAASLRRRRRVGVRHRRGGEACPGDTGWNAVLEDAATFMDLASVSAVWVEEHTRL